MIVDKYGKPFPIDLATPKRNRFLSRSAGKSRGKRGWEGARNNRLTSGKWFRALGRPINEDLLSDGERVRARCEWEIQNNPLVAGIVETHMQDTVGLYGPSLQVHSRSRAYNAALEKAWAKWWRKPDVAGRLSGTSILKLCVRMRWGAGSHLLQVTDSGNRNDAVSARINPIHPRWLTTPPHRLNDVLMGVKRDKRGRPVSYFIEDHDPSLPWQMWTGQFVGGKEGLPADQVIHDFDTLEAGQVTGVPRLATSLPMIAELRDLIDQVMDSARASADWGVYLTTDDKEGKYKKINEVSEIERRMMRMCPPGWKPEQMDAKQPSANLLDFFEELQRLIGRPSAMPLMKIRLDSSEHNYSAARFDNLGYVRLIQNDQAGLEESTLNPLVDIVARESELSDPDFPARPDEVTYAWGWPIQESHDPSKEDLASEIRLQNMITSLVDEWKARGINPEVAIENHRRTAELLGLEWKEYLQMAKSGQLGKLAGAARDKMVDDASDDQPQTKKDPSKPERKRRRRRKPEYSNAV